MPRKTDRSAPRRDPRSSRGQCIAQEITDRLIARLEEGGPLPWRRPWRSSVMAMPLRSTGEAYKGINHLLLSIEAFAQGFTTPYWLTYRQAQQLGGQVRKGERSSQVVYYGTAKRKDVDGGATSEQGLESDDAGGHYRFLKGFRVFNCDQIDGLPEQFHPVHEVIDTGARSAPEIDAFFARMPFAIRTGFDHAAYHEVGDEIVMPDVSRFESASAFAATLSHEAVHASGPKQRLGRDCFARYHADTAARAEEELIAEIGAMMICAHLGVTGEHIDNHAAYCKSWLAALRGDKRFIFKAAAQAQMACDWVLARGGVASDSEAGRAAA